MTVSLLRLLSLLPLLVAVALAPAAPLWAAESDVRFNRDVRPLLSQNCFHCHGPDEGDREAELRLDTEEGIRGAFAGGRGESEAWLRINSTDDDERMPPPDSHLKLEADEIERIGRWIDGGAAWEGHWSFIAPTSPPAPEVKNGGWVRNPIDAFILGRLEQEGLAPSAEADRARLLRRVTLDLTGLPPTLAQIDTFLADTRPDAYERVVDRLLASPRFGERMALPWLDAARYGDTSVFHADGPRDMWPWRDWVIRAYNANKPFNQFTVEQLAGDLLPDATLDQKIATGFNRNNATTDEGGAIAEEYRVEYVVDRVKTTSMVWLGLTMECGQCHDHKYDPITQQEYYRFYAYFNQASDPGMQSRRGNQKPVVDVRDPSKEAERAALEKELPELEKALAARADEAGPEFEAWLATLEQADSAQPALPTDAVAHFPLDESEGKVATDAVEAARQAKVEGTPLWAEGKLAGAFRCDGKNYLNLGDVGNFERTDRFSYGAWIRPKGKGSGAALARMDDGNRHRGFDLFVNGGKVAVHIIHSWSDNAIKVNTKQSVKPDSWQHIFVTYDGSSKAAGIKIYFDGKPQAWTIEQDRLSKTIRTDKPLYVGRRNPGAPFAGDVDDVRVYSRALSETEVAALAGADPLGPILALPADQRSDAQWQTLRTHYLNNHDPVYRQRQKEVASTKKQLADLAKPITNVMVMQDVAQPRMTYILDRGNYASPRKDAPVEPGVPAALPPLAEGAPANRLGMARWLVDPNHPLTARVTVNRYWYMLFGTGIVETVEDFGSQGAWPSHPDLLDWLARDFVEQGWDIKRTIRQIVTSATYRQTSRVTPALLERDPANRLLARGPRFRLQGEFIRDSALSAAGLLVEKVGGRNVKPYQPPGLWNEVSLSGNVRFVQDQGESLYRRSLYTYWKRSSPAPSLTIFDTPSREKCTVRRARTNTPLQALVTLNDPQFVEASRGLAARALKEGGDALDGQITHAYRLATGVAPRPATLTVLRDAYQEELAILQADAERAKKLLAIGESPRDEKLDPAVHAAMTIVASMILNLDETLTRG